MGYIWKLRHLLATARRTLGRQATEREPIARLGFRAPHANGAHAKISIVQFLHLDLELDP
jgi:hypothetical protein